MRQSVARIRMVSLAIILVALLFIGRLYGLQIHAYDHYSTQADRQYVTPQSNLFERGSIFMQKKDGGLLSAASLRSGFKIAINPSLVRDPEQVYEQLAPHLELDRDTFIARASKPDDPYEEIATKVDEATKDAIEALDLTGVQIFRDKWRYYPGEATAAQVIGFLGYQGDELAGRYGLERQFDNTLQRSYEDRDVNFFAEVFTNLGSLLSDTPSEEGDLVLTIEPTVQLYLERQLNKVHTELSPEVTGGIIINPTTGRIAAMAVAPNFDVNQFGSQEDISVYSNPLVESVFEMGSILKPLIVATALNEGAIDSETLYYDEGYIDVTSDVRIWNFDKKGRGYVTPKDILAQSLNTGMVYIGQQAGRKTLQQYLGDFQLAERTGIDLPNEVKGLTSNLDSGRPVELANISFGQGIALSPIATARALSAMANGGYLVTPHVTEKITYEDGGETILQPSTPVNQTPLLRPETSEEIARILVSVVDDSLRGGEAKLPDYSIAAKTGTAQIPNLEDGGYYTDRNLHSFFGYFPAYNPEFLVFLFTKHPKGATYAAESLTDPFLETAKFLISYYDIPPDR